MMADREVGDAARAIVARRKVDNTCVADLPGRVERRLRLRRLTRNTAFLSHALRAQSSSASYSCHVCNGEQANGDAARAIVAQRMAEDARVADLRGRVERRLRLRRLMRDPALPPDRFLAASERMLHNAGSLAPLLEGNSIRVSYLNQVAPDGTYVDIAWDFEV
jgi:hypothetical protein